MTHKKNDRNARKALNEFKYEMSKELGANNFDATTEKLSEAAKNQMGNNNKR